MKASSHNQKKKQKQKMWQPQIPFLWLQDKANPSLHVKTEDSLSAAKYNYEIQKA